MASTKNFPSHIWMDEKLIPYQEATVHVMSACARYGTNVFEGLCGYWNASSEELYCFRLQEHYLRLLRSMRLMLLELPYTVEDHIRFMLATIRKNELREDIHIRHQVLVSGIGNASTSEPVSMFICALPRAPSTQSKLGIRCCVSSWTRISDKSIPPRIKAGSNYQNSRLAQLWARRNGFDDAILLNEQGKVAEAPAACIGIVRNGRLITPSITQGILEGVTRSTILELAQQELNIEVEERDIDRTELYVSEEAFLFGTAAEVKPIVDIDGFSLKSGDPESVTRRIQRIYTDVVRGENDKYRHWLTPVYGTL